jgi:hypothetical protein
MQQNDTCWSWPPGFSSSTAHIFLPSPLPPPSHLPPLHQATTTTSPPPLSSPLFSPLSDALTPQLAAALAAPPLPLRASHHLLCHWLKAEGGAVGEEPKRREQREAQERGPPTTEGAGQDVRQSAQLQVLQQMVQESSLPVRFVAWLGSSGPAVLESCRLFFFSFFLDSRARNRLF